MYCEIIKTGDKDSRGENLVYGDGETIKQKQEYTGQQDASVQLAL
jgi:hypothetical protein